MTVYIYKEEPEEMNNNDIIVIYSCMSYINYYIKFYMHTCI